MIGRPEDAEDLAVEKIEDVGEQQEQQDKGAGTPSLLLRRPAQKLTPSDNHTWRGAP